MITATSFHGFGGAFAVALKNVGIPLVAVAEPEGFGAQAISRNRNFLNFDGPIDTNEHPVPYLARILVGNPPCSGFSALNQTKGISQRGPRSQINRCMWDFIRYAIEMGGPDVVVFESVQLAYTQGRDMMRELWKELRSRTGRPYHLTHVLMSGASVGSAQVRRRYFFVAHVEPFGITSPQLPNVVTVGDAIRDLEFQPLGSHPRVATDAGAWARRLWSPDGMVYDHDSLTNVWAQKYAELHDGWLPGTGSRRVMKERLTAGAPIPESWSEKEAERHTSPKHFSEVFRVLPDAPGRVITGEGGASFMHWSQPRLLTIRETARLMGFPDAFRWDFASHAKMNSILGKQVPVQSWEWILDFIKSSLMGAPGGWEGHTLMRDELGTERLINVTNDFKRVYHERRRQHGVDSRTPELVREIRSRPA